jgi:Putative peptidoglycan binding domain
MTPWRRHPIWMVRTLFTCVVTLAAASISAHAADGDVGTGLQLAAVFGTDDRTPLPGHLQPLRERLGVLFNIKQRSVCSAFCVDATTIGTAAHCLFKTSGEKAPKLADFWFARNYDTVRDYARIAGYETNAAAQNVVAGAFTLSTAPPIDATKDWAFVRLSRPVCSKGSFDIEPLPVEQILREAKAGRVFQLSYHKDFKQWQPAYSKPCAVERTFGAVGWNAIAADFNAPEHLLLHACDTGGASSGSPLLLDTPQGPKVIGINVGTYIQSKSSAPHQLATEKVAGDAIANTGVAATSFAAQAKAFRAAFILSGVGAVRELQERLRTEGLYTGAIDGTYGPTLKVAIEGFEASARLPLTGFASEDVLSRLRLKQAGATNKAPSR